MGKSKGSTTQTTAPDAATQAQAAQLWSAASAAGNSPGAGIDPSTTAAAAGYGAASRAGNLGLGALSGDMGAYRTLANPYQSAVTDQTMQQYGRLAQLTSNGVNDEATRAGAFGGGRHGVAEGVALGQLGQGAQAQLAQINQHGYDSTMARAGGLANLGMGADAGLQGIGEYSRQVAEENNPDARRLRYLGGAFGMMPHGTVQTGVNTPGHNGATGFLGGAATGASLGTQIGGPGWGTAIGAAGGGLLGMFG